VNPVRLIARPMLASIFLVGGTKALLDPEAHAPVARDVTDPLREASATFDETTTVQLVQLNGLAQVVGGALLVLGRLPRLAALLLAGSLVPTTLAAHRFWEEDDPASREQQTVQFFKNVSLLGGLIIASTDREGEPSLVWQAGHAADHARLTTEHAKEVARLRAELAKRSLAVDPATHARVRRELLKEKLTPDIMDAKRLVDALRSDD
jgi:putative oxidoreductase